MHVETLAGDFNSDADKLDRMPREPEPGTGKRGRQILFLSRSHRTAYPGCGNLRCAMDAGGR